MVAHWKICGGSKVDNKWWHGGDVVDPSWASGDMVALWEICDGSLLKRYCGSLL